MSSQKSILLNTKAEMKFAAKILLGLHKLHRRNACTRMRYQEVFVAHTSIQLTIYRDCMLWDRISVSIVRYHCQVSLLKFKEGFACRELTIPDVSVHYMFCKAKKNTLSSYSLSLRIFKLITLWYGLSTNRN